MLDEKFDNITADIGRELKDTARRIYKRALVVLIVFFVIELIAAIAISADSGEQVSAVLLALLVIAVEYFIARGFVHLITINLYAKGEMVHLLQKANLSKQNTEAVKEKKVDYKVKPLSEMLKHALNCQTDDSMILYLKTIEDTSLAPILQLPKNCVRAAVVNLLERLERL